VTTRLYAYLYLRGFRVWITYRTNVVLTVLAWVLPVFTYFFVGTSLGGKLVEGTGVANYESFVVIGLAFQGYVSSVIATISQRIRNEQLFGTLEYYVLTKSGVTGFLFYSALWSFVLNTVSAVIILLSGVGLGVKYDVSVLSTLIILVTLIAATLGIAMISGGLTMIIKQGNPIAFFFSSFTTLVSGTVFPVSVLPSAVRLVSYAIPLTWALNALRESMLSAQGVTQLGHPILILLVFDVVTMPLGIWVYTYAFKRARIKGTLGEY
jgi:ABC-2 type transport system permease protein